MLSPLFTNQSHLSHQWPPNWKTHYFLVLGLLEASVAFDTPSHFLILEFLSFLGFLSFVVIFIVSEFYLVSFVNSLHVHISFYHQLCTFFSLCWENLMYSQGFNCILLLKPLFLTQTPFLNSRLHFLPSFSNSFKYYLYFDYSQIYNPSPDLSLLTSRPLFLNPYSTSSFVCFLGFLYPRFSFWIVTSTSWKLFLQYFLFRTPPYPHSY